MNLQSIIEDLANRADELLADVRDRKEARSTLADILAKDYPKLRGFESQKVVSTLMEILEEEEFFDSAGARGEWSDGAEEEEE